MPNKVIYFYVTDGTAMPSGQTDPSDGDKYNIPVHLAPKQRELFLRIQQQQRERDVSVNAQQNSKDKDGASSLLPGGATSWRFCSLSTWMPSLNLACQ